jgi:exodeoxyribonuclease V gamma subunit
MFVYRSNHPERLVDALARVVEKAPLDPMVAETVVVEGRGIERWLARSLADRLGVWANAEFPFPRAFLRRTFGVVLGVDNDLDPFDPDTLAWSIAAALPGLCETEAFREVARYLEDQPGTEALLALSRRIARTLDQYVVYRPDWIAAWERGRDDHWQAVLWREVVRDRQMQHIAKQAQEFQSRVGSADLAVLPPRVCLFGLSTLAPIYLECFAALARRIDVHLFLHSPSGEYWGDIRNRREVLKELRRREPAGEDTEGAIVTAAGNPLLASLGGLGRDFQAVLEGSVAYEDEEDYVDPGTDTMLHALQHDILRLIDRRADGSDRLTPAKDDDSLQIHCCHGPLRELQVLHDRLRDLFEHDPSLHPHDVVVLCPDIDAYAPLIEAVFGAGPTADDPLVVPAADIPFRVADRRVRQRDEVVDAFLRFLAVLDGRLTATDVVDLVDIAPIRERFAITDADVEQITTWVGDAAIRWAIDAEHRAKSGQPPLAEHTWRFGLDRLFLGYAMAPGDGEPVAGRVPAGEIDATPAAVLGAFSELCETLFRWHREARRPRPADAWRDDLSRLVGEILTDDRASHTQRQEIREALEQIAATAQAAKFTLDLDLPTIRTLLEEQLERSAPGRDFLTGSVTFCALVPMRSVPFQVVCLLGMNDDVFPRRERRAGFDRMAAKRRLGDRSTRDDDRYLFLEALLAARKKLLITYVGRDQRDNSVRPPSTAVSELIDVIDTTFTGAEPERKVSDAITVVHPLQPFSQRYFDASDAHLWSYSQTNLAGARALSRPGPSRPPFTLVAGPLAPAPERVPPITVDRLARFLANPARAFLRNRLGLVLADETTGLEDREPIELDGLAKWQIGDAILARGRSDEASFRAAGDLPPGSLGTVPLEDVRACAEEILAAGARLRADEALDPVLVDVVIAGVPVTGLLDALWPTGRVQVQYATPGARHLLDLWVRHLFLNLVRPEICAPTTTLVARGDGATTICLRRVEDPLPILESLVALYQRGHEVPLPLFPLAAEAYCRKLGDEGHDAALKAARSKFAGDPHHGITDSGDPAIAAVFGTDAHAVIHVEPVFAEAPDLTFVAVARAVFEPLLGHILSDEPGVSS